MFLLPKIIQTFVFEMLLDGMHKMAPNSFNDNSLCQILEGKQ